MNGLALWRRLRTHCDWPLVLCTLAIAAIGLVNLYSATRAAPKHNMFEVQIWWMALGLPAMVVLSALDYRLWLRFAWIALGVCMVLIVAVHYAGHTVKGSRRWLGIGPIGGQPSELMKLAAILVLARLVHDRASEDVTLLGMALRAGALLAAVILIAWQPDLGTAVLVALICLTVAVLAARRIWPIFAGLAVAGAAVPVFWAYVLKGYQKKRILTFMDPSTDPSGAGWHARQSIFAIGSGRLAGKGYLHGTQNQLNFLPEHWTDFPFSVWAEEWGFAGSAVLLGLYLFLILWIINIASQARDRFGATLCVGVAAMFLWHVVVNIAMVTGLAPVVGVTLPLVSYGGSSVLTMFIGLGLVASVSIRRYAH
jgi:rod shape determining protein RodA